MRNLLLLGTVLILNAGCSEEKSTSQPEDKFDSAPPVEKSFNGIKSLTPESRSIISQIISSRIEKQARADLKRIVREKVLRSDIDNNGLSLSDLSHVRNSGDTMRKISNIHQIFVADQDGDAVVTTKEFEHFLAIKQAQYEKQQLRRQERNPNRNNQYDKGFGANKLKMMTMFRNADTDENGAVTLEEAYVAPVASHYSDRGDRALREFKRYKPLDFNGDGLITPKEVDAATDKFLTEAEELGIEIPEVTINNSGRSTYNGNNGMKAASLDKRCNFPKPSAGAKIIRLSAYEGSQLSNMTVGGQDEETSTSEVKIENGRGKIYLVASSYNSHIWRFTGNVSRIEHVVLSSLHKNDFGISAAGQTGLPRAKTTISSANCTGPDSPRARNNGKIQTSPMPEAFGKRSGSHLSYYDVAVVFLPSGRTAKLPESRSAALKDSNRPDVETAWKAFVRFNPGGVYTFNAKDIIAKSKVEKYETLPNQAGIVQLLISGAIKQNGGGDFVVRKKMRFPPSMGGAHRETFIVPIGVPAPTGDPVHSCVKTANKKQSSELERSLC